MRMFRAKPSIEVYGQMYTRQGRYRDVIPGLPIRLHNDGTVDPPDQYWENGSFTVTNENIHRIYICQSWKDSVTLEGNEMVAMIPIRHPFDALAIVDAGDFLLYDDVSLIPVGTPFGIVDGKLGEPIGGAIPAVLWLRTKPVDIGNGEYEVELSTVGLKGWDSGVN